LLEVQSSLQVLHHLVHMEEKGYCYYECVKVTSKERELDPFFGWIFLNSWFVHDILNICLIADTPWCTVHVDSCLPASK
jgi:hypothetical protein